VIAKTSFNPNTAIAYHQIAGLASHSARRRIRLTEVSMLTYTRVLSAPKLVLKSLNTTANRILAPIGVKLSRVGHDWGDVSTFIPFAETIAKAKHAGLPLGDYIDTRQGISGATQGTIDGMTRLGVFAKPIRAVVEIGPGTGRYLEKTLRACSPERYEIYETASAWAAYLASTYPVIVQPTDGASMRPTASSSIDLVHAHKVLSATPFIVTARYWCEMLRVTRPGAHIVFDAITENCLSPATVEAWARTGMPNASTYPATIPSIVVVNFFVAHGSKLVGTFRAPMPPGETEVFVFERT
jgi:hypothetical protein